MITECEVFQFTSLFLFQQQVGAELMAESLKIDPILQQTYNNNINILFIIIQIYNLESSNKMFNPDMLKNMNPEYLKNINPEMMRTASEKISSMSNEELQRTFQMAGMGNVDPDMLKKSSQFMKGMKNEDLERMKNFMANEATSKSVPNTNNNECFKKIIDMKNSGNQFFKKKDYQKSSDMYLQALQEIEKEQSRVDNKNKTQLKNLENTIRLNYAISESKLGHFELVKRQTKKILAHGQNAKASFRLAEALYELGQYKQALKNVETSLKVLSGDETVKSLKFKIEQKLKQQKKNKASNIKSNNIKQSQNNYQEPIKREVEKQAVHEVKNIEVKVSQTQKKQQQQQQNTVIIEQERPNTTKNTYQQHIPSKAEQIQQDEIVFKKAATSQQQPTINSPIQISWTQAISLSYIKRYYKQNLPLVLVVLLIFFIQKILF